MTSRVEWYRQQISQQEDVIVFLLNNSNLPGPRGNLELLTAFAGSGELSQFVKCLELDGGKSADGNSPEDFVVCCGIAGFGHKLDVQAEELLKQVKAYASDHRWRIREAVAMAFHSWGRRDFYAMIGYLTAWHDQNPYQLRAIVASLCEPDLLKTDYAAVRTIEILDGITREFSQVYTARVDGWQVLEKALAYGWSVAVAALPSLGKERMEYWLSLPDARLHRIMLSNLKKKRLLVMDAEWVKSLLAI